MTASGNAEPSAATPTLQPIGVVRSPLRARSEAPKSAREGAPDAWVEIDAPFAGALVGLEPGHEVILVTWLHQSRRDVLQVHPRRDLERPLTGVFATRSPDRPNPIGLHRVRILALEEREPDGTQRLRVGPLEAIDGTPVVDVKPVARPSC